MNFFNGCGILLWAFKLYPSLLKGWCIAEMRSVHGCVGPKYTGDSSAWYTCPCPSYIASDLGCQTSGLPGIWAARHLGCWLVDCQCKVIAIFQIDFYSPVWNVQASLVQCCSLQCVIIFQLVLTAGCLTSSLTHHFMKRFKRGRTWSSFFWPLSWRVWRTSTASDCPEVQGPYI